ncbi:hypothetical protein KR074_000902 [Drosophila pseudoananassae]|nr:hypothetical protein KR074_000902 [Drosophila pseudoananassae]
MFSMAAVCCNSKGFLRLFPIVLLVNTALLLVWRNVQQAQQLSQPNILWESHEPDANKEDCSKYVGPLKETSPRTEELQELLKCRDRSLRFERIQHGRYWLLQNLVIGRKSRDIGCAESITYTTIGDYSFFDNLKPLVERWLAPVSFAIHAPGYDLKATLDAIQYVRNCLNDDGIIKDWVSFHVYFPNNHMPKKVPFNMKEVLRHPYTCTLANGTQVPPPYTLIPRSESYKNTVNLTYPINVGRNIARQAVNTHFILASDIELYPSLGFVDLFLDMVAQNHSVLALDPLQPRRVYPLPVFEIASGAEVPNNKSELLELYKKKLVQGFHEKLCGSCHKVPRQKEWLKEPYSEEEQLKLFSSTLREKQFRFWEPFYVSDNTEPLFDERVTWEGQSNKRIQNYAMCLMGYEYHVLHPAFLVHSPGIKKVTEGSATRKKFAEEMTKFINVKIKPEYHVLYGKNSACQT